MRNECGARKRMNILQENLMSNMHEQEQTEDAFDMRTVSELRSFVEDMKRILNSTRKTQNYGRSC